MKCYVDSSVILAYLLSPDRGFERVKEFDVVGSSELLTIECRRVIHRYRLEGLLKDTQLEQAVTYLRDLYDGITIFEMTSAVKKRAADSFPTVVGTLDAIHLATASLWATRGSDPFVLFTYDRQMATCAHTLGLHTVA